MAQYEQKAVGPSRKQVNSAASLLCSNARLVFAGGALTSPLIKGVYSPLGNFVQEDCIPLNPVRHSSPPQVSGYSGGFFKVKRRREMKKISLMLVMVLGVVMMLTLCYSSQAQAQAVSLQCTMNGDQSWPAGTYNILIEADRSIVTVTMPNGANIYFKPSRGKYLGGVGCWCQDYVEATSAMYDFGYFCDAPYTNNRRQFKIDRISGEITHTEGFGSTITYKGTCTKTELHRQF
jgi:hypothetical protein